MCFFFILLLFLTQIEGGGGFHKKITHIPKIEGPLRTHLIFMMIYLLKIIYSLDPMVTKPYLKLITNCTVCRIRNQSARQQLKSSCAISLHIRPGLATASELHRQYERNMRESGAQWAREEPKCAKTHVWGFLSYKSRGNVWISRNFRLNFITNIFSDV